ncbi:WXG100 family type VII secretion target [Propionicicella superfundia]|uniref:WXG100 family type VII secretion target n=1 Tax=Propionicicella superfundia TaxID=348582 RepID=UPI00040E741D|nr:WXG100 family type VII secretion target [Propionicicella superfundia]
MAKSGANLEDLDALKKTLTDAAGSTSTLRSSIDSTVQSAVWEGRNADAFRESWQEFRLTLEKIQNALQDASADVQKQRDGYAAVGGF